ncbi:MAG: electron transfer flavoprotein subunit alpha/FixB family protein [Dehalococcoidales bacterium]|nr:electron transfer flavoprotein subunit alpha/FixB family protein [Dehalococcoidales bacterium]
MAEYKGVLVLAEVTGGRLSPMAMELFGCGRKLADDLQEDLYAVLLGDGITNPAQSAISFGADSVYTVDDPALKGYSNGLYAQAMESVVKQLMPRSLLLGQTATGRDLAPSLAFRLETTATTDCIELVIDSDSRQLLQTKPVYGGNALATFTSECYPQIATVRAKAYSPPEPDTSRQGEVIAINAKLKPTAVKTLERVSQIAEGVRLEDAAVVVAGGRGIGSADGFKQLEELAGLFNGAVGATRPPCDNGWIPSSAQIGLTGKIIAPDLYLAIAISGSSQHTSGCAGAKNIVAINKDPEANIFKVAHFGIVGDWKKVLPAFTVRIRELVSGQS